MILNEKDGSITVFLVIVLSSVIMLAGILVEAARVRAGELLIKRSIETAMNSALAGYTSELKTNYGIFALHENDPHMLRETVESYVQRSGGVGINGKGIDLYGFKIENIEVTPLGGIDKDEILRGQILKHMEYRVPKQLIQGMSEILLSMLNIGNRSKEMSKKAEIEEKMAGVQNLRDKLDKEIEKSRDFNSRERFKEMLDSYIYLIEDKIGLEDMIKDAKEHKERKSLEYEQGKKAKQIKDKYKEIISYVRSYCEIYDEAKQISVSLVSEAEIALANADELKGDINTKDEMFAERLNRNIGVYKGDIYSANIKEVNEAVTVNEELIKKILQKAEKIDGIANKSIKGNLRSRIKEAIEYEQIIDLVDQYDKSLPRSVSGERPGKEYEKYKKYDARTTVANLMKNEEWEQSNNMEAQKEKSSESQSLLSATDFNSLNFITKAFNFVAEAGDRAKKSSVNLKEELYINEYILSTFKNAVKEKEKEKEEQKDIWGRETFYNNCEVEYILTGNPDETFNKNAVKGELLLLRFACNISHLYMDPVKNKDALNIAISVSGWTGFGVPVVHTLIMSAWSMAEAMLDIRDLLNGDKIPLYKTNRDWRLKIGAQGIMDSFFKNSEKVIDETVDRIADAINDIATNMIDRAVEEAFSSLLIGNDDDNNNDSIFDRAKELNEISELRNEIRKIALEEVEKIKKAGVGSINSVVEKEKERVKKLIGGRISVVKERVTQSIESKTKEGRESLDNYLQQGMGESIKNDFLSRLLLMSYKDYLRILLLSREPNIKLQRIKRLINVNMGLLDSDFMLSGHNTSIEVKALVSMKYIFLTSHLFSARGENTKGIRGRHQFKLLFNKSY